MDVLDRPAKVFLIPNYAVIEACLPNRSSVVERSVNRFRREALEVVKNLRDIKGLVGHKEKMEVIGHNGVREYRRVAGLAFIVDCFEQHFWYAGKREPRPPLTGDGDSVIGVRMEENTTLGHSITADSYQSLLAKRTGYLERFGPCVGNLGKSCLILTKSGAQPAEAWAPRLRLDDAQV
jgi:hypothetical protein